jgi:sugar phosphate permease
VTTQRRVGLLLALSYVGFVSLGLPDGLLGVAWPSIRARFGLELDALGPLLVATTAGYVFASFSSGRVLAHMNLGALLAASCAATATSLLGYAFAPAWFVLVGLALPDSAAGRSTPAQHLCRDHHSRARSTGCTPATAFA